MTVAKDRRATISDVAARARVSIKTVSRVLNNLPNVRMDTRERVVRAIADLDFVADIHARRLAARRSQMIALVVPGLASVYSQYLYDIIRGVIAEAETTNFQAVIVPVPARSPLENSYVRFLREGHADGLVVILRPQNFAQVDRLARSGLPVAVIDDGLLRPKAPSVAADNRSAARIAVEHLLRLGHQRIAHLAGDPVFGCTAERAAGYREALEAAGLGSEVTIVGDDHIRESGRHQTRQLLDSIHPPTAIFCAADDLALGAMDAARERGLVVGRDLAIVGFNDTRMAVEATPPLTTIHQPLFEFGQSATKLLVNQIEGTTRLIEHQTLSCHLVIRSSCGVALRESAVG